MRQLAHVGLGSNIGDRPGALQRSVDRLARIGHIHSLSSVYETAPVGYVDQPAFLNAALSLETALAPDALVDALLAIERDLGRIRTVRNGPRVIDLDLLLVGDTVVDMPHATVPHPRLHERSFVLVPLAEIAAGAIHPVLHRSIGTLLDDLGPQDGVSRVAYRLSAPAVT